MLSIRTSIYLTFGYCGAAHYQELKTDGVITEDEFQQQKQALLGRSLAKKESSAVLASSARPDPATLPLKNRWWFQLLLLWLIIPVGIILMLSCEAYIKQRGQRVRITRNTKGILIVIASLLWALGLARLFTGQGFQQDETYGSAASAIDRRQRLQLASELRDAREMCHAQGTEDHPITVDQLNEMAENQITYFTNINRLEPSLLTEDDRKCRRDARSIVGENSNAGSN